jgi:predicted metalloprotease
MSDLIQVVGEGEAIVVLSPEQAGNDGRGWRKIQTSAGSIGWVVAEYVAIDAPAAPATVARVSSPTPARTPPPPTPSPVATQSSTPARAPATPASSTPRRLEPFIRNASDEISQFWREQLHGTSVAFRQPKLLIPAEGGRTACGSGGPSYCPVDATLVLPISFFVREIGWPANDAAVVVVVAHEWGHHAQNMLGISLLKQLGVYFTIQSELQADCFAGGFFQYANGHGWLDSGDMEEAALQTLSAGDPRGTPWFDPSAHGSGPERLAAFSGGFRNGTNWCLKYTPVPSG